MIKTKYKKYHGKDVLDPFLWLDEDNKNVKKIVKQLNKKTDDYFNNDIIDNIKTENNDMFNTYNKEWECDEYHNLRIKVKTGLFIKKIIYIKPKNYNDFHVILDLNDVKYDKYKFIELIDYQIDSKLNYFTYLLDETGKEDYNLYVDEISANGYNIKLNKLHKLSNINSYILLSNYNKILYTKSKKGETLSSEIYLYDIQNNTHKLIYTQVNDDINHLSLGISLSNDRSVIFINAGDHASSMILYNTIDKVVRKEEFKLLLPRLDNIIYDVEKIGKYFYLKSNLQSNDYYIYRLHVNNKLGPCFNKCDVLNSWEVVYKHKKDCYIKEFICFKKYVIMIESNIYNDKHYLIKNYNFKKLIPIEKFDKLKNYKIKLFYELYDSDEIKYNTSCPYQPSHSFKYNMKKNIHIPLYKTQLANFYPSNYTSKKIMVKDINIPMTFFYKKTTYPTKESFKNAPLYITGYGSYGSILKTGFRFHLAHMLKNNIVCVYLHVRGGGEGGYNWHKNGKMLNKINSITDFENGIKFASKYFNTTNIAIHGRSAGGIIIGNALIHLNKLVKVAIPEVPFIDCLTTMMNENLPLTKNEYHEFGNPEKSLEDYNNIMSYSPYENIVKQDYPAIYLIAGLKDQRVLFHEPLKFYFKINKYNTGTKDVLLEVNPYGHFGGTEPKEIIEEISRLQFFIYKNLGLL